MTVRFTTHCPNCDRLLKAEQESIGRTARCPACDQRFHITRISASEHANGAQSLAIEETRACEGASDETVPDRPSRETGSDEPSIGQIGRFDLKQLLGGGGFGLVFRAYDPVLGRAVAVKVPRFSRHDKKKLQRFVLEAQAAGKLRHPNIVTVFESGESQGKYYIASEYVPGVPLSEQIQIARPTFEQSAQWLGQLADALDYAHREGILHRDIKPANIMIDAKKRPQIMDFGLAKLIDQDSSQTIEGSLLGTPAYMSPEQARGALEEVGPHSDQYSLGVVMYELITGVRPFSGAPHEVIAQVLADTPPAPREVNPEIPADLEAICLKTMAKPPSERYADTALLADDLRRYLEGLPVAARTIGTMERTRRWARRNPVVATLSAAATVLLVLLVVVMAIANARISHALKREGEQRRLAESQRVRAETEQKRAEEALKRETAERERAETAQERAELAVKQEATERERAEQAFQEAEYNLYRVHIPLAQQKWLENDLDEAARLLNACPPRLRHWEWGYLKRICQSEARTLPIKAEPATELAFSSDCTRLAAGSGNAVIVWDTVSWQKLLELQGHAADVYSVAFSPDDTRIVSSSHDRTAKVWDASTGQELLTFRGHHAALSHRDGVFCVRFSPDGRSIASGGSDGMVRIWNVETGIESLSLQHPIAVWDMAFSPDGSRIAATGAWLQVWDTGTGAELFTLRTAGIWGSGIAFSPDGKKIAISGFQQPVAQIIDADDGKELQTFFGHGIGSRVRGVAFSPDGNRLVTGGGDATVRIWDAATGKQLRAYRGHKGAVIKVTFSPDGKMIASTNGDSVKVWDAAGTDDIMTIRPDLDDPLDLTFSPDGNRVAVGGGYRQSRKGVTQVFDTNTGGRLLTLRGCDGVFTAVAYSNDGKRIAAGSDDGIVNLWDALTGEELLTLQCPEDGVQEDRTVRRIAFSPESTRIAASSGRFIETRVARIWSIADGHRLLSLPRRGIVAFSPDGKSIAASSQTGTEMGICDATTGQVLLSLPHGSRWAVAFSRDGRLLAERAGRAAGLFDVARGQWLVTVPIQSLYGDALSLSPDGRRIVSGGRDGALKVWDTDTGHELLVLHGHEDIITDVAFSDDGSKIATASRDGTVKIWEAAAYH